MITFKNVHKWYKSLHVLNDVSLTVDAGEVVVICGPSGSGKSTLIRTVNGLEPIQSGELSVDGQLISASKINLNQLRTEIGFVFQQFNLYPHLTALDNVSLAPIRVRKERRQEAEENAQVLLERVGLGDKSHSYPTQLSGGQQQRVAIARALAMRPKIMLFDEPTSALDPEMIGEVLSVIQELAHTGITMMIVTHEMGFASKVANRVVFMDQGKILEVNSPDQFFASPKTARAKQFIKQVLHHDY